MYTNLCHHLPMLFVFQNIKRQARCKCTSQNQTGTTLLNILLLALVNHILDMNINNKINQFLHHSSHTN
uniref:Uncharacterized protein n=1 Tax=Anguilla anguilla TaxID=7936 RepID=A0A0E9WRP5_ANGAN